MYKIGRQHEHLYKLFITFTRTTLEHSSVLSNGCSLHDAEKLEKAPLWAARIIGLPVFESREALLLETGWGILQTRRYIAKMKTLSKFNMGILLDYSFDIIPSKRKIISQYNIRNKDQFIVPKILD